MVRFSDHQVLKVALLLLGSDSEDLAVEVELHVLVEFLVRIAETSKLRALPELHIFFFELLSESIVGTDRDVVCELPNHGLLDGHFPVDLPHLPLVEIDDLL